MVAAVAYYQPPADGQVTGEEILALARRAARTAVPSASEQDAEEMRAAATLAICEARTRRCVGDQAAYLFRAGRNAACDAARGTGRRQRAMEQAISREASEVFEDLTPAHRAELALTTAVHEVFAELGLHEALVRYLLDEIDASEAAAAIGCARGTLYNRALRVKRVLASKPELKRLLAAKE